MKKFTIKYEIMFTVLALFFMSFEAVSIQTGQSTNFKSKDIIISTGEVEIGGTLLVPHDMKSTALVIFISGSSWQDRNNTIHGFPMFELAATHLANNGIASFRYDDRGVGTSTGDFNNSTISDLTNDVIDITNFFNVFERIPFRNFILIGHSQGGIVATRVARGNPNIKGVVLAASPGVSIAELVLYQTRNEFDNDINSIEEVEEFVSSNNKLLYTISKRIDSAKVVEQFKNSYSPLLRNRLINQSPSEQEFKEKLNSATELYVTNYGLPALTSFLYVDPIDDIRQTTVPVLSLHGGRDTQVKLALNKDRIEMALIEADIPYQIVVFEGADHFFKENDDNYGSFVQGFLDSISSWILTL